MENSLSLRNGIHVARNNPQVDLHFMEIQGNTMKGTVF